VGGEGALDTPGPLNGTSEASAIWHSAFGIMALDQGYSFNFIQVGSKVTQYIVSVVDPCSLNLVPDPGFTESGSESRFLKTKHWKNYVPMFFIL
jgi:hypothetical protein